MNLSTGFMNGVTSLFVPNLSVTSIFVPNLSPNHDNNVGGPMAPPTIKIITTIDSTKTSSLRPIVGGYLIRIDTSRYMEIDTVDVLPPCPFRSDRQTTSLTLTTGVCEAGTKMRGASIMHIQYDVTGLLTVVWRSHSGQIVWPAGVGQGRGGVLYS